jgi:hypothetical protein
MLNANFWKHLLWIGGKQGYTRRSRPGYVRYAIYTLAHNPSHAKQLSRASPHKIAAPVQLTTARRLVNVLLKRPWLQAELWWLGSQQRLRLRVPCVLFPNSFGATQRLARLWSQADATSSPSCP